MPTSAGLGGRQQFGHRILAEQVEDDLQRGAAVLLEAEQTFLDSLDAGAPMGNQPVALEVLEPAEDGAILENRRRHAVKLGQIKRFDAEAPGRALEALADAVPCVLVRIKRSVTAELGGDVQARRFLVGGCDAGFAQSTTVDVGRIPEIDAELGRRAEDIGGHCLGHLAEIAPQLPAPESDFGNLVAGFSKTPRSSNDRSSFGTRSGKVASPLRFERATTRK